VRKRFGKQLAELLTMPHKCLQDSIKQQVREHKQFGFPRKCRVLASGNHNLQVAAEVHKQASEVGLFSGYAEY
jgi:hypothetical protein